MRPPVERGGEPPRGWLMRKGIVLPGLFLIVVTPIAAFVLSGAGSHMSPLLLYPFASPWWMVFLWGDQAGKPPYMENVWLLVGCAINLVLLTWAGFVMDRRSGSGRADRIGRRRHDEDAGRPPNR